MKDFIIGVLTWGTIFKGSPETWEPLNIDIHEMASISFLFQLRLQIISFWVFVLLSPSVSAIPFLFDSCLFVNWYAPLDRHPIHNQSHQTRIQIIEGNRDGIVRDRPVQIRFLS